MAIKNEANFEEKNEGLKAYSLEDIEKQLGVTTRTLRKYLKEGKLKGRKIGNRWVVTEKNLQAFLDGDAAAEAGDEAGEKTV